MGSKIFNVLLFVVAIGFLVFLVRSGTIEGLFKIVDSLTKFPTVPTLIPVEPRRERIALPPKEPAPLSENPKIDPSLLPEGFTAADISRYAGDIDLSVSRDLITIRAVFSGADAVNMGGWTLKSKRGTTMFVPRAVNIYEPSGLAPEGDVILRRGEILKIHFGSSAIGVNFRLNKCTGYLENSNDFSPSLPRDCPRPIDDFDVSRVSGVCEDYIRSLTSCRLPEDNPNVPDWDYLCREYLDRINLRGCYDRHRFDPDFLDNEWWAWSQQGFLDPDHDTVLLLDREGKLVDVYKY